MDYDLLVITPFGPYVRGQRISDPTVIATMNALGYSALCEQVPKLDAPPPTDPVPVVLDGDVIILSRQGGESTAITIAQLRAFLGVIEPPSGTDDLNWDDNNGLQPALTS